MPTSMNRRAERRQKGKSDRIRNTGSPVRWWRVTTNRTPARDRPGR